MSERKYDKKEAAKDTGSSVRDVSHAWHQARDAAQQSGGEGLPRDRHDPNSYVPLSDSLGRLSNIEAS